jgi:hypothetical protein
MMTSTSTLEQLQIENSLLKGQVDSLREKISYLEEQIDWFKRQIFGQKSEKFVDPQTSHQLFFYRP